MNGKLTVGRGEGEWEIEGERPRTTRTVSRKAINVKLEMASTDVKKEEIRQRSFGVSNAKTTNLMVCASSIGFEQFSIHTVFDLQLNYVRIVPFL